LEAILVVVVVVVRSKRLGLLEGLDGAIDIRSASIETWKSGGRNIGINPPSNSVPPKQ
jgi:hypothetical protein